MSTFLLQFVQLFSTQSEFGDLLPFRDLIRVMSKDKTRVPYCDVRAVSHFCNVFLLFLSHREYSSNHTNSIFSVLLSTLHSVCHCRCKFIQFSIHCMLCCFRWSNSGWPIAPGAVNFVQWLSAEANTLLIAIGVPLLGLLG